MPQDSHTHVSQAGDEIEVTTTTTTTTRVKTGSRIPWHLDPVLTMLFGLGLSLILSLGYCAGQNDRSPTIINNIENHIGR